MKKLVTLFAFLMLSCSLFAQSWMWAKQGAGLLSEGGGSCLTTDASGNVFMAGYFRFNLNFGSFLLSAPSFEEIFVVKYDTAGNPLWANQSNGYTLGSTGINAYSIATDINGNVCVTGDFANGMAVFGTDSLKSAGTTAFVVKYDAAGNFLWTRQATSSSFSTSIPYSVTTDKAGAVYIAGTFQDTIAFSTDTLITRGQLTGLRDVFITKYNKNGNLMWARQSHSPTNYEGYAPAITADRFNNLYLSGYFQDTIEFGTQMLTSTTSYETNLFVIKYDTAGNVSWARESHEPIVGGIFGFYDEFYLGATYLTTDPTGNVYVTGNFHDTLIFGNDTVKVHDSSYTQIFIAKYDPNGNVLWAKQSYQVNSNTYPLWAPSSLTADTMNHVFISAYEDDWNATPAGIKLGGSSFSARIPNGDGDGGDAGVLIEMDTSGKALCGSIIAAGGEDAPFLQAANDPTGNHVYMGGEMGYDTNEVFGTDTVKYYGAPFVARWKSCCSQMKTSLNSKSAICTSATGYAVATVIGDSGVFSYAWAPAGGTKDSAKGLSAGTYTVTIKDGRGCTTSSIVTVKDSANVITTKVCCDSIITPGQPVLLNITSSDKYLWYPPTGVSCDTCRNPVVSPIVTTWYYVTVTDSNGCTARDSVLITVKENCGELFIPNAFSPNNDGQNDILYLKGNCINAMDFFIFDRWGNKVFESENQSTGWDGKYNGQPMTTGTYMWYLKATLNDGTLVDKKGTVALVR